MTEEEEKTLTPHPADRARLTPMVTRSSQTTLFPGGGPTCWIAPTNGTAVRKDSPSRPNASFL